MKKVFQKFTDYFAFTKSERRGIIALLGILMFFIIGIQIMPYCSAETVPNYSDMDNLSMPNRADNRNTASLGGQNRVPQKSNYRPPRERKQFTVQANTCDTLDLQEIRGIGPAFSKRIIKYRDLLGGFVSKNQLKEVWGIDSAKYAQIEGAFIIDKQNIRKIKLNTISINELKTHPYLDYYQAKAIVQTRDSQGLYESVNDILKIALIDQETFDLIKDYLDL